LKRLVVILGTAAIVLAMLVAPLVTLPGYDWMDHTLSDLGGQSMPNAWVMNAGFAAFGLAAIVAAALDRHRAPRVNAAVLLFGAGFLGVALFRGLAIDPALPGSPAEDRWHSIFSGVVGAAFATACALAIFAPGGRRTDWISWTGLVAAAALPMAMASLPGIDGLLQRLMFGISFLWMLDRFVRRET
jgi:hypothetical protein